MPKLNKTTKLKLLIPIAYCIAANVLFAAMLSKDSLSRQIAGLIVTDVAFALWLTARVQLGNAFSLAPKSKYLVTSGLYSKLRHPVYYFSILAVIGISIFLWSPYLWIAAFALVALEVFRIREEEALLLRSFGQEYRDYKKQSWF